MGFHIEHVNCGAGRRTRYRPFAALRGVDATLRSDTRGWIFPGANGSLNGTRTKPQFLAACRAPRLRIIAFCVHHFDLNRRKLPLSHPPRHPHNLRHEFAVPAGCCCGGGCGRRCNRAPPHRSASASFIPHLQAGTLTATSAHPGNRRRHPLPASFRRGRGGDSATIDARTAVHRTSRCWIGGWHRVTRRCR